MTRKKKKPSRPEGKPRKAEVFRCHWCKRVRPVSLLHHAFARRGCCNDCYRDPNGVYVRIYSGLRREREDVVRVRVGAANDAGHPKWCSGCVLGLPESATRCPTCRRPLGEVPDPDDVAGASKRIREDE